MNNTDMNLPIRQRFAVEVFQNCAIIFGPMKGFSIVLNLSKPYSLYRTFRHVKLGF